MQKNEEGAEAVIYTKELFGAKMVLKARKPKDYRTNALDTKIRHQRTRKEAKLLKNAQKAGISVPKIFAVSPTLIVMQKINGKLLKNIEIKRSHAGRLGTLLARLHDAKIVHGDFTPANVMVSGKDLYLIDFGLADSSDAAEEKALDILLMKRQLPKSLYPLFIKSYRTARSSKETIRRLAEIEERGRYQSRSLG